MTAISDEDAALQARAREALHRAPGSRGRRPVRPPQVLRVGVMALTSGAVNARPAPAAPVSACGTGHTIAALYVNPDDGTYQVRYGLTGPPYGQYEPPQAGHHPGGERVITLSADADEARMLAPTWQETARAIRPYLPALPPAALEAYARALHAEATQRAWDFRIPWSAPFEHRHDYTRALITSAREALSHGDQPAAIHQDPNGTWQVSATGIITTIPAVLPRKQDNASVPAPRPALRLVKEAPDDGQRSQAGPGAASCT